MEDFNQSKGRPSQDAREQRVSIDSPQVSRDLRLALRTLWKAEGPPQTVVCIGTDRSTGDALGPLVGSWLLEHKPVPFEVIGTVEDPVHATNLQDCIQKHPEILVERVLAIDASLGKLDDIGCIAVGWGSLRPGAGVSKQLPAIGRFYITGTVNVGGFMEYFVLQNTRLALVLKMASTIAEAILDSLKG